MILKVSFIYFLEFFKLLLQMVFLFFDSEMGSFHWSWWLPLSKALRSPPFLDHCSLFTDQACPIHNHYLYILRPGQISIQNYFSYELNFACWKVVINFIFIYISRWSIFREHLIIIFFHFLLILHSSLFQSNPWVSNNCYF